MDNNRQAGQPAPYGQACLQCYKSKCKCMLRDERGTCERCHRLGQRCIPSDAIRRRRVQTSQSTGSKVAHLEQRIDSLMSLLKNATRSPDSLDELQTTLRREIYARRYDALSEVQDPSIADITPGALMGSTSTSHLASEDDNNTIRNRMDEDMASLTLPPVANKSPARIGGPLDLPDHEKQACLSRFIDKLLPCCPFVHLPRQTSIKTLGRDRPFLLLAISTVARPSTKTRLARGEEFKRILAKELLVDGHSSIDLLLAVLTFVAWSHDTFLSKKSISRLLTLALSILYELGLNVPKQKTGHTLVNHPGFKKEGGGGGGGQNMKQLDTIGNDEEQHLEKSRVILGCYLLSASVSAYYKHMESLPWTPHLEDCLQRLESSAGACPSDSVLVVQVRLQHLAQKAHEIHRHQDPLSPPLILYCDAIREQLRQVETLITPSMAKADLLRAQSRYVELCICDATAEASQNAAEPSGKHSSESLKWIWQSAMAVKSCFEIWTSVSPSIWVGLSIQYTLQVGRCLMTLFRLSTLSGTARDLEAVRKSLDALAIIDCVIGVTAQASVEAGETAGDDLFKKMLRNLQGFREGMLASLTSEQETIGSGDASEDGMAEDHRNRIVPAPVLFEMPAYGFFGTGEWMEQIFDSGPC